MKHPDRGWADRFGVCLFLTIAALLAGSRSGFADLAPAYRQPPTEITELLTAPGPPEFLVHPPSRQAAMIHREAVIGLDRLMRPRLGLAGFRFDPQARTSGVYPLVTRVEVVSTDQGKDVVEWRPADGALLDYVQYSPDGKWLSALASSAGPARFVLFEIASGRERVIVADINAAWGNPCSWTAAETLVCRVVPKKRPPAPSPFAAPLLLEHQGAATPVRTYSNLLHNAYDDALFEHHFTVGFARVRTDGTVTPVASLEGLIAKFDASPDGAYAVVTRIEGPYSRLVPARRFPSVVEVWDLVAGTMLYESRNAADGGHTDDDHAESRELPRRAVWKPGVPVVLGFLESSRDDTGQAVHRWMEIAVPFSGKAREVARSNEAVEHFGWTSAGTPWYRISTDGGRGTKVFALVDSTVQEVWSGQTENPYESPGRALTADGSDGPVLEADGVVFLAGDGRSEGGPRPFLDSLNLATGEIRRLYEAEQGVFEPVVGLVDAEGPTFVTARETPTDAPRLFVRRPGKDSQPRPLAEQTVPFPQLAGVKREVLHYKRHDGLDLSATLYLPAGYQPGRPLPTLVWIYPYEFADRSQAEELDVRAFRYHQVKGPSPLAAVVAGYAVLMNPTVPIMYEGSTVIDAYLPQLVASLQAAVNQLLKLGVTDPERIAVGGRSYGSFSSANLLIHSDLFATAVCMSGAYNRTLTPFGFQHEQRSFWEAGDIYSKVSPFFHADELDRPLLAIHGGADENPGTPPLQARRFVHALIGQGATVRYVELPGEGHHYWARENVLLAAAEMLDWLDRMIGEKAAGTAPSKP